MKQARSAPVFAGPGPVIGIDLAADIAIDGGGAPIGNPINRGIPHPLRHAQICGADLIPEGMPPAIVVRGIRNAGRGQTRVGLHRVTDVEKTGGRIRGSRRNQRPRAARQRSGHWIVSGDSPQVVTIPGGSWRRKHVVVVMARQIPGGEFERASHVGDAAGVCSVTHAKRIVADARIIGGRLSLIRRSVLRCRQRRIADAHAGGRLHRRHRQEIAIVIGQAFA